MAHTWFWLMVIITGLSLVEYARGSTNEKGLKMSPDSIKNPKGDRNKEILSLPKIEPIPTEDLEELITKENIITQLYRAIDKIWICTFILIFLFVALLALFIVIILYLIFYRKWYTIPNDGRTKLQDQSTPSYRSYSPPCSVLRNSSLLTASSRRGSFKFEEEESTGKLEKPDEIGATFFKPSGDMNSVQTFRGNSHTRKMYAGSKQRQRQNEKKFKSPNKDLYESDGMEYSEINLPEPYYSTILTTPQSRNSRPRE